MPNNMNHILDWIEPMSDRAQAVLHARLVSQPKVLLPDAVRRPMEFSRGIYLGSNTSADRLHQLFQLFDVVDAETAAAATAAAAAAAESAAAATTVAAPTTVTAATAAVARTTASAADIVVVDEWSDFRADDAIGFGSNRYLNVLQAIKHIRPAAAGRQVVPMRMSHTEAARSINFDAARPQWLFFDFQQWSETQHEYAQLVSTMSCWLDNYNIWQKSAAVGVVNNNNTGGSSSSALLMAGNDWDWRVDRHDSTYGTQDVRRAVRDIAHIQGMQVGVSGEYWWIYSSAPAAAAADINNNSNTNPDVMN
jgi:hypothetical protein